ncbi:hypothetical protein EI94DRAFT_607040 [Lactarius quietus]|nr:hypothetical protein EI94DRAFT_607040 [Lactarius quietus]
MSQTPATTSSSSNIEGIFNTALQSYKKKTKKDLTKHDLFKKLESCDSPAAIMAVFQAEQFDPAQTGVDDRLRRWFIPTANVLIAFSGTLGAGVGLVFSPAQVVFSGIGVLLLAAKGVAASQDMLINVFGRIESFFSRLEIYSEVPLTLAMTDKMVEITVEVLGILATATKEMKQGRAKKFMKRIAGKTDLEDGLKKLDTLTSDEVAMAIAQLTKIAHNIDNKVDDGFRDVNENVQDMNDNVKAVGDVVQTIADDGQEAKAIATNVELIVQKMADDVDDVKWSQLRDTLRRWQSPPDPSTNHNIASDRQHEGTAEWFIKDDKFEEWKVTGSLLWIHGKRALLFTCDGFDDLMD